MGATHMSKPQNTFQTSVAQQIRDNGKIPMVGKCSHCGRDRAVAFPGDAAFAHEHTGEWVRCPNCDQINYLEKLRG